MKIIAIICQLLIVVMILNACVMPAKQLNPRPSVRGKIQTSQACNFAQTGQC